MSDKSGEMKSQNSHVPSEGLSKTSESSAAQPKFAVGDRVLFADERGSRGSSFVTAIVPIGNYSDTELGYAIRGDYGDYVRVADDIKIATESEAVGELTANTDSVAPRKVWVAISSLLRGYGYTYLESDGGDDLVPYLRVSAVVKQLREVARAWDDSSAGDVFSALAEEFEKAETKE